MTTATPPVPSAALLRSMVRVPTSREVLMAAQLDPRVAIAAIVCVSVVAALMVVGLVLVAVMAGDLVGLSLAIGGTITALTGLLVKLRSGPASGG